jgi:hypothetical protein
MSHARLCASRRNRSRDGDCRASHVCAPQPYGLTPILHLKQPGNGSISVPPLGRAAQKAGLIDPDALALADMSRDDGTTKTADELIAKLKQDKPHLFKPKMAKDMTESERQAWWKEHKRKFPW